MITVMLTIAQNLVAGWVYFTSINDCSGCKAEFRGPMVATGCLAAILTGLYVLEYWAVNLSHQFLIAMPEMADPIFAGTVTYILQHDAEGAIGLIVNRPINLTLGEIFQSAGFAPFAEQSSARPVYHGGPVAPEQGFVLHPVSQRQWESSLQNEHLSLTTTNDILQAIADGDEPQQFLFCLGYSGWSAGQLEEELKQNAWLTVEASAAIIFGDDEEKKYQLALSELGIDLTALAGHGGLA